MGFSSWCAESFCNKKRTESKVRQIVSGLMIFAGVLHFIYLIVAMAGTWDARFQPVRFYLNASSLNCEFCKPAYVYKPNPAALSTGLLLGITGSVLIYFGLCMMFEIGDACDRKQLLVRWFYPGFTCALNLLAMITMIINISTPKSIYCTQLLTDDYTAVYSCVNRGLQTPIGVGLDGYRRT